MSDYSDLDFTIIGGKLVKPRQDSTEMPAEKPSEVPAEVPVIVVAPETPVASPELTAALGAMTTPEVEELAEVSHESVTSEVMTPPEDVSEPGENEPITYRDDFRRAVRTAYMLRRISASTLISFLKLEEEDHFVADELIQDMEKFDAIRRVPGTDDLYMAIIGTIPEIEEVYRQFDAEMAAEEEELAVEATTEPDPSLTVRTPPVTPLVVPITPVTPPAAPTTPPVTAAPVAPTVPRGTNTWKFYVGGLSALVVIGINLLVLWKFRQNSGFLWIFDFTAILLLTAILNFRFYPASLQWARQQLGNGRAGTITIWALGSVVVIFLIFAVSQLSCAKHHDGSKYGKLDSSTKGSGLAGSPARSDSAKIASAADSIATLRMNTEAFTAALRVLEQPGDNRMATDADEDDQYNMPHLVWTRFMEEGHAAGKTWNFGDRFYPALRDTVMQWWVRTQFLNGETVETLAPRWLNRIKNLDVDPDTAQAYGYRLVQEFRRRVTALHKDGTFDFYKRSTKNILIPNPEKEKREKETREKLGRIVFLLAGLGTSWLLMSSLFGGKKATLPRSIAACAVGAVLFTILGFYPVATMTSHFFSTAAAVVMMSLVGIAFGYGYLKR